MAIKQEIIIWDTDGGRLHEVENNLKIALRHLGIAADIKMYCEVPLLSRFQLIGKTPAIQVNGGEFWRHTIGKAMTVEQLISLFEHLRSAHLLLESE